MSANRHELSFSDADLLTLSAALQVYHTVAPEFGRKAWMDPESEHLYDDGSVVEMEEQLQVLLEKVNSILRVRYPDEDWLDAIRKMNDDEKRVAFLGTYAWEGAKRFIDLTGAMLEQISQQINARNN